MELFSTVDLLQKGWVVFGVVLVASMCLKQVSSMPSPVPSSLSTVQGNAHLGRGGFPHCSASPVIWSKVLPAPVL